MSWLADRLYYYASIVDKGGKVSAATLRSLANVESKRFSPFEDELIGRLVLVAEFSRPLEPLFAKWGVSMRDWIALVAEESGGYRLIHNLNTDGSEDLGPYMINSVHNFPRALCLSYDVSLVTVILNNNVKARKHPFAAWNAYTSGRFASKYIYADEALRRLNVHHPSKFIDG